MAGLFCGLVRQFFAVVLIEVQTAAYIQKMCPVYIYTHTHTHTYTSMYIYIHIASCIADGACALVLQPAPAANMHCTDSSQVGGDVWLLGWVSYWVT